MHFLAWCLAVTSCDWVSLAAHAVSYDDVGPGEAANLASLDTLLYATAGSAGLTVIGLGSGNAFATIAPPPGSQSIDDIAIAGTLLFVLDAVRPGHLSVFSLAEPLRPRLVGGPEEVPVGPFSGVSAADGLAIVSGGTSALTAWAYDLTGALRGPIATGDLGRGQPDVRVAAGGQRAFVSTHYFGPHFGLDLVRIEAGTRSLERLARVQLRGAGFSDGGARPSNFPLVAAQLGADTVLVAHARGIAVIVNVSDTAPRLAGVIDVGGSATSLAVLGNTAAAVIATPSPAVVLVDFTSAARVFRRYPLPPGTFPLGLVLAPSRIAVAIRHQGVLIFDR